MKKLGSIILSVALLASACSTPVKNASEISRRNPASGDYWKSIVDLCVTYSGATHPPCDAANGAPMILGEVLRSCVNGKGMTDTGCLNRAVSICREFSGASHPPCYATNGLKMVLDEIARSAPPVDPGTDVVVLQCDTHGDALDGVKLTENSVTHVALLKIGYPTDENSEVVFTLKTSLDNIRKGISDTLIGVKDPTDVGFGGGVAGALIRVADGMKNAYLATSGVVYTLECQKPQPPMNAR